MDEDIPSALEVALKVAIEMMDADALTAALAIGADPRANYHSVIRKEVGATNPCEHASSLNWDAGQALLSTKH